MVAALPDILCHDGGWMQAEERTGHDTDRQVLVIGDSLGAVVAAGFLEHAGLDPILAPSANESTDPPATVIWQPGLALLERLGLCRPVVRRGRILSTLDCLTTGQSWQADDAERPALVAIDRSTLQRLVDTHVLDRVRMTSRAVTAVESTTSGVRATFGSGVTEPFDAAVTAERSCLAADDSDTGQSIHTWTFEWPNDLSQPDGPTEAWTETDAAFTVPVTDTTYVHLVTSTEIPAAAAVSVDDIADRFGHLFSETANPLLALNGGGFTYRRVPNLAPLSRSHGHTTRIGMAARGALPGCHLGPTLDIESAWTLADSLAYGPAAVDDALDAYQRRRRRRATRLWGHSTEQEGTIPRSQLLSPLQHLLLARRLAFGHVVNGTQSPLVRDIPESL